jgi:probable rRNA maturation factor
MIEINNLTRKNINKKPLEELAKKVLKGENKGEELSIAFVGKKRIRDLNKKYRKQDRATDVLSFGDGLNEIVICLDEVGKGDLAKILIHGILHISGYEHGEQMDKKQNYYLNKHGQTIHY